MDYEDLINSINCNKIIFILACAVCGCPKWMQDQSIDYNKFDQNYISYISFMLFLLVKNKILVPFLKKGLPFFWLQCHVFMSY